MYLIREVLYCKPGKVRTMVDKFKALSAASERVGYPGFRIYTDVGGERFWTVVVEFESESMDAFPEMEGAVMADEAAREAMAGYHDLILQGRREIYKVEA